MAVCFMYISTAIYLAPYLAYCGQLSQRVSEILMNIGSGNGFSPSQYQAITWTNADLLSIFKDIF